MGIELKCSVGEQGTQISELTRNTVFLLHICKVSHKAVGSLLYGVRGKEKNSYLWTIEIWIFSEMRTGRGRICVVLLLLIPIHMNFS